ncbi:MAG: hypothetical protein F6J87_16555 [Spirulina sp. SIO3F2]|nr:hypothetical protein [Spirulina sp. SIO3F2]
MLIVVHSPTPTHREDLSTYVAELQLHMTLQARKLVPTLQDSDSHASSRDQLLHDSQADLEKLVSRQTR